MWLLWCMRDQIIINFVFFFTIECFFLILSNLLQWQDSCTTAHSLRLPWGLDQAEISGSLDSFYKQETQRAPLGYTRICSHSCQPEGNGSRPCENVRKFDLKVLEYNNILNNMNNYDQITLHIAVRKMKQSFNILNSTFYQQFISVM